MMQSRKQAPQWAGGDNIGLLQYESYLPLAEPRFFHRFSS
jgi:hypothetical protein